MIVNIEPITFSETSDHIQITLDDFQLNATTGKCRVYFYDINTSRVLKVEHVTIPESVYANWGTDDQFIVDYVVQALNVTPSTVVPDTTEL